MAAPPAENPYVEDPETDFAPIEELDSEAAETQAATLRDAIRYHDHRYYVEDDPVIADCVYDVLFSRLQELEDAFDLARADSPTQRVGGEPRDELEKIEHVVSMLSIDAGREEVEVREFDDRVRRLLETDAVRYLCEPKFDGLSIEVVYVDGRLDRAATRGDGDVGEDVGVRWAWPRPSRARWGCSPI